MLVNWKVEYCNTAPENKQPPDYFVEGQPYWFYKYFENAVSVEVEDIHTFPWLERFEKEKLRFYIVQTIRVLFRLKKYDLIVSHGMQSGVVLSLFRRIFKTKAKHIVFDIGSFNSAAESGAALKLMQFASKSIDGFIYHTERQIDYYKKFFPWILDKSEYIPFGTDAVFFGQEKSYTKNEKDEAERKQYILCVGYAKRDWNTLYEAYEKVENKANVALRLIGKSDFVCEDQNVEAFAVMPINELIEQIRHALFCVLPLQYFNYSFGQMTLLQQMSLGKAVITAKVPSMEGYVKEGETALFYEPENADHLAKQMELLLQDHKLRERIGQNAGKEIREEYNEKNMAQKIEIFYRKIVEGREV